MDTDNGLCECECVCKKSIYVYVFHRFIIAEVCFHTWLWVTGCVSEWGSTRRGCEGKKKKKHGERSKQVFENMPDFYGTLHWKAWALVNIKQCCKLFVYLFIYITSIRRNHFSKASNGLELFVESMSTSIICMIMTMIVLFVSWWELPSGLAAALTVYCSLSLSLSSSS